MGLQLDDDICERVGSTIGTIVVDGMLVGRVETTGRSYKLHCVRFSPEAPVREVVFAQVERSECRYRFNRIVGWGLDEDAAEDNGPEGEPKTDRHAEKLPMDPDSEFLRSFEM